MTDLPLSMNLGHSRVHPLAGWNILIMLYQDGTAGAEPMTRNYLIRSYNQRYREVENGESLMVDQVMTDLLKVLTEQARLVEVSNRKVRERWESGKLRIMDTAVYRISSRGIEFVKMMERVIEAENTVVANTEQIDEYYQLVVKLTQEQRNTVTTGLFNDFSRMLVTYDDVMKGMRKLDVDLHEIATDLAFNHGSEAAQHLKKMLFKIAIPAYSKLLDQAARLKSLADDETFAADVASSRQGQGNIDATQAIDDASAMVSQRHQIQQYVTRQLTRLAGSFTPSASGIQNNFDSIYLVFQTLMAAVNLLTREIMYRQQQAVDLVALTADLDKLLQNYQRIRISDALPKHIPMDRHQPETVVDLDEDLTKEERTARINQISETERHDLLEADSIPRIFHKVQANERQMVSESDNPEDADDDQYDEDFEGALEEIKHSRVLQSS